MSQTEAKRFYGQYKAGATTTQNDNLRALTFNSEQQKFRSPFFYGLYRFEEGFSHIGDFVQGHLKDHNPKQQELVAIASLVSIFSQAGLPERLMAAIAQQDYFPGQMLSRLFGQDADRLFVCFEKEDFVVKASHPLIAQQILEKYLGVSRTDPSWRTKLSSLARRIIDTLKEFALEIEAETIQILMHLFIQREHIAHQAHKTLFSPLIVEIADEPYQAEIFRRLTQMWPDEAHFWNHFARHCMYSQTKKLDDAISHLNTAIDLAPDDELHQHTLGMVYSSKVTQTLGQFEKASGNEVSAWKAIERDYRNARACFELASVMAGDGNLYPYIGDIQIITRTISVLRAISTAKSWLDFLRSETIIVDVLRQELSDAIGLLAEAKKLTDESSDHPDYVEAMDFYVQKIESSADTLIKYLNDRILQPGGDSLQNRRFLLSVQEQQRKKNAFTPLSTDALSKYLRIAEQNLEALNPTDSDFRHWFGLYRESSQFNATEAIDKCERWSQTTGSLDSAFYLYTLYFTLWYDGAIRNLDIVISHLDRCLSLSQERNRRPSLEFLAATPSPGIVPVGHLGSRDSKTGFFSGTSKLGLVEGTVVQVTGPQSGMISVLPIWFREGAGQTLATQTIKAFFVPAEDFHPNADENVFVQFYLGFRRGGLRAYVVTRA